ncbi:MAG: hypothetical protein P8Z69_02585 [Acidihalobacter sp.]
MIGEAQPDQQRCFWKDADALITPPNGDESLSGEERQYYAKFEVPDDLVW